MLGYLAEAAAAYGCSLQRIQQLQEAAGLAGAAGSSSALLWRLVSALNSNRGASLSFLKNNLPADITYGQIKVWRQGAPNSLTDNATLAVMTTHCQPCCCRCKLCPLWCL